MRNFIKKIQKNLYEAKKIKQKHPLELQHLNYIFKYLLLLIISLGCFEFVGLLADKLFAFNYQFYAFNLSLISSYILIIMQYEIEYRNQIEQDYQIKYLVVSEVVNVVSVFTGFYSFLFLYVPKYTFSQVEYLILVTVFLVTSIINLNILKNKVKENYKLLYIITLVYVSLYYGIKVKIYSHFITQVFLGLVFLVLFLLIKILISKGYNNFLKTVYNDIIKLFKDSIKPLRKYPLLYEVIDVYIFVISVMVLFIIFTTQSTSNFNGYYDYNRNKTIFISSQNNLIITKYDEHSQNKTLPRFIDIEPDYDFKIPKYTVENTYEFGVHKGRYLNEIVPFNDKIAVYNPSLYRDSYNNKLYILDNNFNELNVIEGVKVKNMFVINNQLYLEILENQGSELNTYVIDDNDNLKSLTEKVYQPIKGFNEKEYYLSHGVLYEYTEDEGYQVLIDSYIEWIKFESNYVLFQEENIIYKYSTSFEEVARLEVYDRSYDNYEYQIYPFDNEIVVLVNDEILFYDLDFNLLETKEIRYLGNRYNIAREGIVFKDDDYYIITSPIEFNIYDKDYKLVYQDIEGERIHLHTLFEKDGILYGLDDTNTYKLRDLEISETTNYTKLIFFSSLDDVMEKLLILLFVLPLNVTEKQIFKKNK